MTEERLAELMVKVTDDVATAAEREELMSYIAGQEDLRKELESHMAMKAVTDGWVERLEYDLAIDKHDSSAGAGIERLIGVGLLIVGTGVLTGWGTVELFADPEAPMYVKAGVGMLVSGTLVLLFSAIRWRMSTSKDDRYTEVIR